MGGWCFQLNGLFHWLLTELGFNVAMTGSSTRTDKGEWGNVKDHMALIAKIDGKSYLVDVGFGQYRVLRVSHYLYFKNLSNTFIHRILIIRLRCLTGLYQSNQMGISNCSKRETIGCCTTRSTRRMKPGN